MRGPVGRPKVAVLIVVLAATAIVHGCGPRAERQTAPEFRVARGNVLLISIDTLRSDRLGAYGYPRGTSPVLDRLARESVVFGDVLSQSATTAPSHRSIFTGRYVYEHRNGAARFRHMSEIFRDAGYETAAFVDGGQLRRDFRLDAGFDLYHESAPAREGSVLGGGLADLAPEVLEWLGRERDRPFFLFVHTYDVHCPYDPPAPYRDRFTRELNYTPEFEIEGKCGKDYFNELDLDGAAFEYISGLYDGGVRYADARLAEILDECRRVGGEDGTIVVVTSDHGEALGERDRVGHNQVVDVQLKVPLLLSVPGVAPRATGFLAQSIDILPTLASLVGLEPEETFSGEDLMPVILEERRAGRRFRLAETGSTRRRTVRLDARWSLLTNRGKTSGAYDLFVDPNEMRNVAADHEEIVQELEDAYDAQQLPVENLSSTPSHLGEETRRQLEALGYVGN